MHSRKSAQNAPLTGFYWEEGMTVFYDVTRAISDGMLVYPGDRKVSYQRKTTIEKDGYNWSELEAGTHIGTHIDAPLHFVKDGASLDSFPFDLMVTTACVIETDAKMLDRKTLETLSPKSWRVVFFKTRNQTLWSRETFSEEFVCLTKDGAEFLVEKGTRLVGIDYLSIEEHATHDYPVHKILLPKNIFIIEGLYLNEVPAGEYDLFCLPLKLKDGDGGSTRVLLRSK